MNDMAKAIRKPSEANITTLHDDLTGKRAGLLKISVVEELWQSLSKPMLI